MPEETDTRTGHTVKVAMVGGLVGVVLGGLGALALAASPLGAGDSEEQLTRACQDTAAAVDRVDRIAAVKVNRGEFTPAVQSTLSDAVEQMDAAARRAPGSGRERSALLDTANAFAAVEVAVVDNADADSWNTGEMKRLLSAAYEAAQTAESACSGS